MTETNPDVQTLERAVAGRYALERELGRGGMGVVLLARDLSLERSVALKLLPALMAAQPMLRERFLREARTAAGLSHPHIVPIHAVEAHENIVFIAMAFVDGETLAERVTRTGPLPPHEVARILREVAWALAYAHGRDVVHRDIKPENILIERGSGRAMVADFGIAQASKGAGTRGRLTLEGQLLGSAAFMSPEQGEGGTVDGRSDIYSLGSVGFFALTGRAPFEATTLEALLVARFTRAAPPVASARPDTPAALAAALDRCLSREPNDRYATAEALADALSAATANGGARDIALPVRSFLRAAEQTVWLATLIVVFTVIYGLPATRNLAALFASVVLGVAVLSIDLVRRARELEGEGFSAADVQRGFAVERETHAEELRQLFDARRTEARRRTRRTAWTTLGAGVIVRLGLQYLLIHRARGTPGRGVIIVPMILTDLINTVSLVVALNTSPRTERRAFRLAAWVWESRFATVFFRIAVLGRRPTPSSRRTADGSTAGSHVVELVQPAVASCFPDLRELLVRMDSAQATMRLREFEVTRALGEAGGGRTPAAPAPHIALGDERVPVSQGPDETALNLRRTALLAEMRDVIDQTRTRRTTLGAALENVRIQLLRVGAGIGTPEDMHAEVATLRTLAATIGSSAASTRQAART